MFTWDGMELTIDWPENIWASLRWYHWFFVSGAYGLITHLRSLPEVYRNLKERKKVRKDDMPAEIGLIMMLLFRVTISLPYRIVMFMAGIVWVAISIPARGKFPIRNSALRAAWRWYEPMA